MTGQVVIVTGAAGNMGRAVLARICADGDTVAAVDREQAWIDSALKAAGAGEEHLALPGIDLTDAQACEGMVQQVLAKYGRLDAVVHTVGGFAMASLEEGAPALYESMFRLNAVTTVNVFRAAAPTMRARRHGVLIAIGAGPGLKASSGMAAYAASKAAVHRIVESYADELKADEVRVNALLPSTLDTPQNRAAMPGEDFKKWVAPERIADTIAFLIGPGAEAITGALIPVTGRV
jgi:NAD(P)-dependent dehydrogenase (short-subunit alcohol dehydrogenase family)